MCDAYTERYVPLARGGRRHLRCVLPSVAKRSRTEAALRWSRERTFELCAIHLAMWDEGRMPRLRSDDR